MPSMKANSDVLLNHSGKSSNLIENVECMYCGLKRRIFKVFNYIRYEYICKLCVMLWLDMDYCEFDDS